MMMNSIVVMASLVALLVLGLWVLGHGVYRAAEQLVEWRPKTVPRVKDQSRV